MPRWNGIRTISTVSVIYTTIKVAPAPARCAPPDTEDQEASILRLVPQARAG
ncbi:hypothetical protein M407DRAFT_243170, partial [Tulasnella calospora MUT 4182]